MSDERFWSNRLRWRLYGAWQWPAFVILTIADGIVLDALPPVGSRSMDIVLGLLIATFANLFLVGVAAPWLARRLHQRRAAALAAAGAEPLGIAEREVVQDRVGTALLVAGLFACLAAGLGNREVIVSDTEETTAAAAAFKSFVLHSGDEELKRNLETANTIRLEDDYFRICIARDDRRRHFCMFADTGRDRARLKRDPSAEPNSAIQGP